MISCQITSKRVLLSLMPRIRLAFVTTLITVRWKTAPFIACATRGKPTVISSTVFIELASSTLFRATPARVLESRSKS